jgi:hypothetical protein
MQISFFLVFVEEVGSEVWVENFNVILLSFVLEVIKFIRLIWNSTRRLHRSILEENYIRNDDDKLWLYLFRF